MRRNYIDNLRWICILLLIPFHAAMAWNSWGEGNYVYLGPNKGFSTFIVLLSPWYMPLLFVLAGISMRYALKKRSTKEFLKERIHKLLIPLVAGILTVVAAMAYYGDKINYGYEGNFFSHYKIFFTRFTMLTGYDGGFTPGHLWFLLYLLLTSLIAYGIIKIQQKWLPQFTCGKMKSYKIVLTGILVIACYPVLNIADKSLGMYLVLLLSGYYLFYEESIMDQLQKNRILFLIIGLICDIADAYLYIWVEDANGVLNTVLMLAATWFMILGILGLARTGLNQKNKITTYFRDRSFLFYIFHFIWLIVAMNQMENVTHNMALFFLGSVLIAYILTFATVELVIRIPFLCFLFGAKSVKCSK